jgi:hypothetical protein
MSWPIRTGRRQGIEGGIMGRISTNPIVADLVVDNDNLERAVKDTDNALLRKPAIPLAKNAEH